jgi:hypothetical protein
MVDHLTWRRRVGERVAMAYAESSKVAATALGGSVARGWADEFSDVEIFVFWSEAPTSAERVSAVERSRGSIDVSWFDAGAEERWLTAMRANHGQVGQLWPYEDMEWSEHYFVDNLNIGVSGFLVSTVDNWVEDLTRGIPNDDAEMVAATIVAQSPVTGEELLEAWASALTPYPQALALAVIERWLRPDEQWWSIGQLAAREDRPAFDAVLVGMQKRLIRLLLAANGTYLLDPKPKWTRKIATAFEHQPDDFVNRLERVQTSAPIAAARLLQQLIDETMETLTQLFPAIDIEQARWLFRLRRGAFSDPGITTN